MPKIGRNDPCPCGSGRKYKHCCGSPSAQAAAKAASQALTLPDLPDGLPMADMQLPDLGDTFPTERLLSQMGQMERALAELTRRLEAEGDEDGDEDDDDLDLTGLFGELLSEAGAIEDEERTPLEEAQDLMYDAWDSSGSQRVRLARQALQLSPDCADAYVLLAEETAQSRRERLDLYRQGVEAGERALGPDAFEEYLGHFWGVLTTRPYMRAREGLAVALWDLHQRDEAVGHLQEMLRLNPGDNQGVRYVLLGWLLELGRDEDVKALLEAYPDEFMASWAYGRALYLFKEEGTSAAAGQALARARKANPYVPEYLLGQRRIPKNLPEYIGMGDRNEAISTGYEQRSAWLHTPGALPWLATDHTELIEPEPIIPQIDAGNGLSFFLNPYADARSTRCPECDEPTRARIVNLVVVCKPWVPVAVKQQARLCEDCQVLVAHADELERELGIALQALDRQDLIGEPYVVAGTIDRANVRQKEREPQGPEWLLEHTTRFAEYLTYDPDDLW